MVNRYLPFLAAVFLPAAAFGDFFAVAVFFAAAIFRYSFKAGAENCADPLAPRVEGRHSEFTPLICRSRLMT